MLESLDCLPPLLVTNLALTACSGPTREAAPVLHETLVDRLGTASPGTGLGIGDRAPDATLGCFADDEVASLPEIARTELELDDGIAWSAPVGVVLGVLPLDPPPTWVTPLGEPPSWSPVARVGIEARRRR